jgi:hypothetical protein
VKRLFMKISFIKVIPVIMELVLMNGQDEVHRLVFRNTFRNRTETEFVTDNPEFFFF